MEHIVIIGNGISGVTAARYIRKQSDKRITIISAETDHFFSRTALMYIYMGHMKYEHTKPYEDWFWKKNRIELLRDYVQRIDFGTKTLFLAENESLQYDKLILAVGSKPNKFGWKGENLEGVQGLYSYQDVELLEKNTENIERSVIVGGGLIGVELAEMLHSRNINVSFLVRETNFWGSVLPEPESKLIGRHLQENHIDMRFSTELDEIIGDESGRVKAVKTKQGKTIDCQLVCLAVGVRPNIDFLKSSDLATDKGILVNEFLETNIPDVYALGDCAQFKKTINGRKPIEQVWYTGKAMGKVLAKTICGSRTAYSPGNWFNSAKFFEIEYQTYGWVFPKIETNQSEFYWEHPKGDKAMHFVYESESRKLVGVNTFGIRLRHDLFDRWMTDQKPVEYVLEHLKDANFDPEFYKQHEAAILEKFNQENGTSLQPKKKSWKRILAFSK